MFGVYINWWLELTGGGIDRLVVINWWLEIRWWVVVWFVRWLELGWYGG